VNSELRKAYYIWLETAISSTMTAGRVAGSGHAVETTGLEIGQGAEKGDVTDQAAEIVDQPDGTGRLTTGRKITRTIRCQSS